MVYRWKSRNCHRLGWRRLWSSVSLSVTVVVWSPLCASRLEFALCVRWVVFCLPFKESVWIEKVFYLETFEVLWLVVKPSLHGAAWFAPCDVRTVLNFSRLSGRQDIQNYGFLHLLPIRICEWYKIIFLVLVLRTEFFILQISKEKPLK